MARGLFGNLATDAYARVAQIEATIAFRKKQLEAARAANADNVEVFERTVRSLEAAIDGIRQEALEIEQGAIWVVLSGVAMLVLFKAAEGFWANRALEKRFSEWLSNRKVASGVTLRRTLLSIVFCLVIVAASILHYAFPASSRSSPFPDRHLPQRIERGCKGLFSRRSDRAAPLRLHRLGIR